MKQLYRGPQDWRHKPSSSISSSLSSSASLQLSVLSASTDKTSSPLATQQPVVSTLSVGDEDEAIFSPPKLSLPEISPPQRSPKRRERSSTFSAQEEDQHARYTENSRLSKQVFKFNPFQPQQSSFCFLNPSELRLTDKHRRSRGHGYRSEDKEFRRAASLSCIAPANPLSQVQQPLRTEEEERRHKQRQKEEMGEDWKRLMVMIPRDALADTEDFQVKLMDKFMVGKDDKPLDKLKKLPSELKLEKSICRIVQTVSKDGLERNFIIEKLNVKTSDGPKFKKFVDLSKVAKARRCWDEKTQVFVIVLVPKVPEKAVFLKVVPHRKTQDLLGIIEKIINFLTIQDSTLSRSH